MPNFRRLALLLLLAFTALLHAEDVATLPAPTGYIDDYAQALSAPAHDQLEAVCRELHAKTHAQVFLVTIHSLDGDTKENFANQLFEKWKIGEKKTDRGILILLAIDDHKRWIEVGYGFEGVLNDAKVGDIGREMVPPLKAANYDEAARVAVDDIVKVIAADSNVTIASLDGGPVYHPPPPAQTDAVPVVLGVILIFSVSIFFIILLSRRSSAATGRYSRSTNDYSNPGPAFLSSTPTCTDTNNYIPADTPSYTSDSSSSISSGSDSFGGGDGGMSGGGGAGGDW
jgi:uncharacterized protein